MNLLTCLKALGDPTRYRIFQALLERKHCVRSLSKQLGVSESAISQHMKILKEAGLVYGQRFGYHIHYFPSQEALDGLVTGFQHMQQLSQALDRDTRVCQCEFRRQRHEQNP